MILYHTKHIKDKRHGGGGRIEPTHIKSNLLISYGSRTCMQGRNPVKHNTDAGCRGEAAFIPPQTNMSLRFSRLHSESS